MKWSQHLETWVWYKLRRRTRNARNRATRAIFAATLAELKPGDICIDCGANVGAITKQLASSGALVHAFEPEPNAFNALQQNVGHLSNVVLHQVAVGASDAQVKLFLGAAKKEKTNVSEGATVVPGKSKVVQDNYALVKQVSLTSLLPQLGERIAIMKVDIEGAEVSLLNDLIDKSLHTRIGHIFVETHEKQIPDLRSDTMQLVKRCKTIPNIHLDWW